MATQTKPRTVIKETGNVVYKLMIYDDRAELRRTVYPLSGYGNNYGTVIKVQRNGAIEVADFCDTYRAGACRSMSDYVVDYRVVNKELAEQLYNIMADATEDNLSAVMRSAVNAVEEHVKRLKEDLDELFDELMEKFGDAEKLRIVKAELSKMDPSEVVDFIHGCLYV